MNLMIPFVSDDAMNLRYKIPNQPCFCTDICARADKREQVCLYSWCCCERFLKSKV